MKLFWLPILFLSLLSFSSVAQNRWKVGAYESFVNFQLNEPSDSFSVHTSRVYDQFINGLVEISSYRPDITHNHLRWKTALINDGFTLYVNLAPQEIAKGYLPVHSTRTFVFFQGRKLPDKELRSAMGNYGLVGSLAGVASDNTSRNQAAPVDYVFNSETGRVYLLEEKIVNLFLNPYDELYFSFKSDPEREDMETMKIYLDILNEMIETEKPE
jgi:hypothetical protein